MACDCTTYECLETVINIDPCKDEIELKLQATQTGSWTYAFEFNKLWFGGTVSVNAGDNIKLPYNFNEKYIHRIKFYDVNGDLVNDTCYSLDTSKIIGSFNQHQGGGADMVFNIEITEETNTVTDARINGDIMVVFDGNQSYNRQPDNFTQTGNSFTMTSVYFYAGQIITVILKH